jgi:hypothetical protein
MCLARQGLARDIAHVLAARRLDVTLGQRAARLPLLGRWLRESPRVRQAVASLLAQEEVKHAKARARNGDAANTAVAAVASATLASRVTSDDAAWAALVSRFEGALWFVCVPGVGHGGWACGGGTEASAVLINEAALANDGGGGDVGVLRAAQASAVGLHEFGHFARRHAAEAVRGPVAHSAPSGDGPATADDGGGSSSSTGLLSVALEELRLGRAAAGRDDITGPNPQAVTCREAGDFVEWWAAGGEQALLVTAANVAAVVAWDGIAPWPNAAPRAEHCASQGGDTTTREGHADTRSATDAEPPSNGTAKTTRGTAATWRPAVRWLVPVADTHAPALLCADGSIDDVVIG